MGRGVRAAIGAEVEATLGGWGAHGESLGVTADGEAVSVLGGIPGERVKVTLGGRGEHRAWGTITGVLEADAQRVTPPCDRVDVCGGCPWMHLSPAGKHHHARAQLVSALEAHLPAGSWPEPLPVEASPRALGYRRRASFVFGGERGDIMLGAYAAGSHRVIDVGACPVTDPALLRARDRAEHILSLTGLPLWDEARGAGVLRHLVLQADPASGAVFAVLVVGREEVFTDRGRPIEVPWDRFGAALLDPGGPPGSVGVFLSVNGARGNQILGPTVRHLAGRSELEVVIGPDHLVLPAGVFAQVNLEAADHLYDRVSAWAGEGPQLVDLFCGVGAVSLRIGRRFGTVVGVEFVARAVEAAQEGARRAGLAARFLAGDAADLLETVPTVEGEVVVVNPPRRGMGAAVLDHLITRRPRRIVYVSCNPRSLAVELARLVAAGWEVRGIAPFDLFPGTPHLEVVVWLERS